MSHRIDRRHWPHLPQVRRWCEQAGGAPSDLALKRAMGRAVRLSAGVPEYGPPALFYALADVDRGVRPLAPGVAAHVVRAFARHNGLRVRVPDVELAAVVRLIQARRVGLGAVAAWLEHHTEVVPANETG